MALPLYIPPCIHKPAHALHLPPIDRPLRIQIEGPFVSIQKLVPDCSWHFVLGARDSLQPGGEELAKLTYRALYGIDIRPEVSGDMTARDEYLGWVMVGRIPQKYVYSLLGPVLTSLNLGRKLSMCGLYTVAVLLTTMVLHLIT